MKQPERSTFASGTSRVNAICARTAEIEKRIEVALLNSEC